MSVTTELSNTEALKQLNTLELAQELASRMAIPHEDWHRLKGNRSAQAKQQAAAALVFLLKEHPEEALLRLQQAVGWLDRSVASPVCPTHGKTRVV